MTIPEIIDYHLNRWFALGPPRLDVEQPQLREFCEDMITDALDQHTDGLATRLKLAEETAHMGWRLAKDRGVQLEELKRDHEITQDTLTRVIGERDALKVARDDAVAAAKIGAEDSRRLDWLLDHAEIQDPQNCSNSWDTRMAIDRAMTP